LVVKLWFCPFLAYSKAFLICHLVEIASRRAHLDGMNRFGACCKTARVLVALAMPALAGCGQKPPPPPPVASSNHVYPTHAQTKLPTLRLWLGASEVSAEMALTDIQIETGMMFRTNLEENSGMIFPLPYPQQAKFWMLHCPLPLTAAFIDPQGQILEIHELRANDTNTVATDSSNIYYVLEMNQGWFTRHHIEPGTIVRSEVGALRETFVRRNP
jgi:uncharacterized membrane protein (UPF0127 family)/predicted small lipoprotein YifL